MANSPSTTSRPTEVFLQELERHVQPLAGGPHDYDALLQMIGKARFATRGITIRFWRWSVRRVSF